MQSNGYARGAKVRIQTINMECGRCGTDLENENGSYDLRGDDFWADGNAHAFTKMSCTYCGAQNRLPDAIWHKMA